MKAITRPLQSSRVLLAAAAALVPLSAALADNGGLKNDPGTIELRLRILGVFPAGETNSINLPGYQADLSNSQVPELDATYFLTRHIAAELIAAVSPHDVLVRNGNKVIDLGKITLLPPTLTLQYHFQPLGLTKVDTYVGAGVNYTVFFDQSSPSGTAVRYDNTFGAAIQAGFDYDIGHNFVANFDVKHIFLDTKVYVNHGLATADVGINPTIVGAGIGYRF